MFYITNQQFEIFITRLIMNSMKFHFCFTTWR